MKFKEKTEKFELSNEIRRMVSLYKHTPQAYRKPIEEDIIHLVGKYYILTGESYQLNIRGENNN